MLILWLKAGCCYCRRPVFCSQALDHGTAGTAAPRDEKRALKGALIDFERELHLKTCPDSVMLLSEVRF